MGKLAQKVAVVTGAAQGIGAAVLKRLVEDGAEVVIGLDMNQGQMEATAKEVDPTGKKAVGMACDVSNKAQVAEVFARVYRDYGKVDILVNNAGITRDAMFHKMEDEQWDAVLKVNLAGVYNCCKAVVLNMRQQKYGKIVNISSTSAHGNAGQTNYAASKAALLGFTKSLAKETGGNNITVNAISPGLINTDMVKSMPEHIQMMAVQLTATKRFGEPHEVASVVSFLSSDDSSFVTGEEILVCGGFITS